MARRADTSVVAGVPRVNLMPRAELERRARAATLRAGGWVLVGAIALVLLIAAAGSWVNVLFQQQEAAEQARTEVLLADLAGLSDVSVALSTETALQEFRADAMAADIAWPEAYGILSGALPAGVTVTGFDLTAGGIPVEDDGADPQIGLSGEITLASPTPLEMGALIRAYGDLPGIVAVDGSQVFSEESSGGVPTYAYRLTVAFDQSMYTGEFDETGGQ